MTGPAKISADTKARRKPFVPEVARNNPALRKLWRELLKAEKRAMVVRERAQPTYQRVRDAEDELYKAKKVYNQAEREEKKRKKWGI